MLRRVALGVALAVSAFLIELGLDDVVGNHPWLVLAFVAVLVGSIWGGALVGAVAALAAWSLDSLVMPGVIGGGQPDRPILEALAVGGAFVIGAVVQPVGFDAARRRRPATAGEADHEGNGPAVDDSALVEAVVGTIDELAASRSAAQVADTLARKFREVSGAASAAVYVRTAATEPLVLRARSGGVATGGSDRLDAADEGPLGRAVRARRWITLADRTVVPVVVGQDVLGVVDLAAPRQPLDGRSRAVLVSLGRLSAEAFVRQRLEAERRAVGDEASIASARVESLSRLAAGLAGADTVEAVAATLIERAVDGLGAEFGLVYERDERDGTCRLIRAKGYPVGLAEREAVLRADADGPVRRAARTGHPVDIGSPADWRHTFPGNSDVLAMTGTQSLVAWPLGEAGHVGGVLVLGWAAPGGPSTDRRSVLAAIADLGAQALERARLYAQERDAHRLQEAFISVISHELRTPITTILAGSRLLVRRLDDPQRAADLASDIEAEADRLFRIVEDLLVLSRLERRNLEIAQDPVHLSHLVTRIVASESSRWPASTFVVPERTETAVVRGEETYIEQVLRNLLSNAAKYAPAGSTVAVVVDDDGTRTTVRVLDEGPGIARDEVEQLFSLFYRSPSTAASAAGAGIGLFVSRRLVDEMGGDMWARARPEGGSEFGFSLATYPVDDDEPVARASRHGDAEDAPVPDGTVLD
ncbi:MAG TPA: ATP-binding protein [Candidatus Limnocylindrales bacterium]|nr:ATP-binding protein [Candidatus Limnocylindrales bacterium]